MEEGSCCWRYGGGGGFSERKGRGDGEGAFALWLWLLMEAMGEGEILSLVDDYWDSLDMGWGW